MGQGSCARRGSTGSDDGCARRCEAALRSRLSRYFRIERWRTPLDLSARTGRRYRGVRTPAAPQGRFARGCVQWLVQERGWLILDEGFERSHATRHALAPALRWRRGGAHELRRDRQYGWRGELENLWERRGSGAMVWFG